MAECMHENKVVEGQMKVRNQRTGLPTVVRSYRCPDCGAIFSDSARGGEKNRMGLKGRTKTKAAAPKPAKAKATKEKKEPGALKVKPATPSGRTLKALADKRFAPGKIHRQTARTRKGGKFECVLRCEKDGFYDHKGRWFETPTALVTTFARTELGQAPGTRRIPSHFFKLDAPKAGTQPAAKKPAQAKKAKPAKKPAKAQAKKAKPAKKPAPAAKPTPEPAAPVEQAAASDNPIAGIPDFP